MGKSIILLLLFCVLETIAFSQDSIIYTHPVFKIAGRFRDFEIDNLGNIYLINAKNEIIKYNDKGDSITSFSNTNLNGTIKSIDVENPLKILVYYQAYGNVVQLDRFLAPVNTLSLRENSIQQARCLIKSFDNNIWLFDEWDNTIKKIDDNGIILFNSTDFKLLFQEVAPPVKIIDYNGLLYLYSPAIGWRIFDYYGRLKQEVPLLNWNNPQIINQELLGNKGDQLYYYLNNVIYSIKVQPLGIIGASIKWVLKNSRLFILKKDALDIYQVK